MNYNGNENIVKQNAVSLNFQILRDTINLHFSQQFQNSFLP